LSHSSKTDLGLQSYDILFSYKLRTCLIFLQKVVYPAFFGLFFQKSPEKMPDRKKMDTNLPSFSRLVHQA